MTVTTYLRSGVGAGRLQSCLWLAAPSQHATWACEEWSRFLPVHLLEKETSLRQVLASTSFTRVQAHTGNLVLHFALFSFMTLSY
jgi:hypothetical protein